MKLLPGPRNNARHIEDELQAFLLLIRDEMIEEIVRCTNMYITTVQSSYDRRDAKILTKTELMVFLGVLFLSGVKSAGHASFLELWAPDGNGKEIFRACMSYNRFLFLLLAIRFDDKMTRNQRKETDILAAIRYILPYEVSNSLADIVERLISHLKGTCRNLTMDNWYTSYTLAMSLQQDKITVVGTLKKNKREIPAEFLPNKQKPISSSMFGFQKHTTLVSFTPINKSVVLLSTMHRDAAVDVETKKPEIIHFYNSTKGGVDTID